MTQNQISYWKLQEDIRAHKAEEAENYRSHKASEFIGFGTLAENMRHNRATEGLTAINYNEIIRHNKAFEEETERSNRAGEALKHEANVFNREVGMYSASVSREVGLANVAESIRHNTATEALQASRQYEEARHNVASENYNYYQTNKDYLIKSKANELKQAELAIRDTEAEIKNYEAETARINALENQRHNQRTEFNQSWSMASDVANTATKTAIMLAPYAVLP